MELSLRPPTGDLVDKMKYEMAQMVVEAIELGLIERIWFEHHESSLGCAMKTDLRNAFISVYNKELYQNFKMPFPGDVLEIRVKDWEIMKKIYAECYKQERDEQQNGSSEERD